MLEMGSDVNGSVNRPSQRTPLDCAVWAGNVEIVCLLLIKGADPFRENANGETPLRIAEARGDTVIAELIRGQDPKYKSKNPNCKVRPHHTSPEPVGTPNKDPNNEKYQSSNDRPG